jgi:uncharacterized membrane protein YeaQ/YmgE (transglycosylase-associated protein family)
VDVVYVVLIALAGGLVVGTLARLAVPGPDPMPLWLVMGIGLVGSAIGTLIAQALVATAWTLPFALLGAVLLVVAYRRLVQGRGVTGPEAKRPPTRGWGILSAAQREARALRSLERMRESAVLTDQEYAARRAELERQSVSQNPQRESSRSD